ncbi:hypothetical protein ACS18Q_17000 [Vibrio sp. Vf1514]|jgi:hypothetical protein|uniref:hypothetical protein n=1 Tax=Vibrio sp. Vf1514 TaxID=3437381 RepID=UPI003F8C62DB
MVQGEYYLHENGSLIYKPHGGVQANSSFVKRVWDATLIGRTPHEFVGWLKEAFNAGAKRTEIERCANANNLSQYVSDWEKKVFNEGNDQ